MSLRTGFRKWFTEGSNNRMTETKTLLVSKKDNPKEFFSELHRIWRDEYQKEEKFLPELIIKLNKENGIDFCQIAADAIRAGFRCFDVAPVLEDALPSLDMHVSSVLQLTECLFEGMQGNMMAFRQFKPFEGLVAKQPDFARRLLTELLKQDKPYIVGYVSNLYKNLSKNNEHEIHKELCALKAHKSKYVLIAVADALGSLDYKSSKNQSLIMQTINVLQELEEKESDEINRVIAFAYMSLLDYSEHAKMKIVELSESEQFLVQGGVSHVLFLTQEKYGKEPWFSDALLHLSNVSCDHKGIMDDLDCILAGLIENNDNWDLAEIFFIAWLLQSDYHSKKVRLSELFDSTFAAFINRHANFEKLLTTLFNHDDFVIHRAVSEIVSYCHVHKVSHLKLDKIILKSLSYEDCLYICRKILGYVVPPESLCSLCFSILEALPRNKEIQGLIYSIFTSHIGDSYPGRTIEFLKNASSITRSKNQKHVADQAVQDLERYCLQRNNLSKLKELITPKQNAQKIFLEDNKKMSAAMEEAQKNSIVSMISSRIVLKHGTGSFHFMQGQYSEISKMGAFSTKFEMPHTEITHPVDTALERMNFRLAKRGQ